MRDDSHEPDLPSVPALIERQLDTASTSWSIGVIGALAEFQRQANEACTRPGAACAVTPRGAIRLSLPARLRACAYETLSSSPDAWQHGIALCVPIGEAAMHRRRAITEVGPDADAIRPADRDAILFDLGLDSPYCDFYVRTDDADLLACLRSAAGSSLLGTGHDLLREIPRLSPHRVFASRLGRIEVYQRIGAPGGATPEGPHTHLLPKLLRRELTHSANVPIPAGWTVGATLYPAHPVRDEHGRPKPFDVDQHHAFQSLLEAYGDPGSIVVKRTIASAVRNGALPDALAPLPARHHRIACRIALRQLTHSGGPTPLLAAWRAALDPAVRRDDAEPEHN